MAVYINQMSSLIKDIALLIAVEWEKPLDRCFVGSLSQLMLALLHRRCDRCEKYYMAAPAMNDKKRNEGSFYSGHVYRKTFYLWHVSYFIFDERFEYLWTMSIFICSQAVKAKPNRNLEIYIWIMLKNNL